MPFGLGDRRQLRTCLTRRKPPTAALLKQGLMSDQPKIVVLVEEDPAARAALALLVSDWGFEAIDAASAGDILKRLGQDFSSVFAIITDFNLGPGTPTGVEEAKSLVAAGVRNAVLVISGSMRGKAQVDA